MSEKELAGKVAIVTGAGRNIGRAIALNLAQAGASVVLNVRSNKAEADNVLREIESTGGKAAAVPGCVQVTAGRNNAHMRGSPRALTFMVAPGATASWARWVTPRNT